jgi:hypothetical protein
LTSSRDQQDSEQKVPQLRGVTRDKVVRALARLLRRKTDEDRRVEELRNIDR